MRDVTGVSATVQSGKLEINSSTGRSCGLLNQPQRDGDHLLFTFIAVRHPLCLERTGCRLVAAVSQFIQDYSLIGRYDHQRALAFLTVSSLSNRITLIVRGGP
jgi:hypothetical protein